MPKPDSVKTGMMFLYVAVIFGLLGYLIPKIVLWGVATCFVKLAMNYWIGTGSKWGRNIYLVIWILGVLGIGISIAHLGKFHLSPAVLALPVSILIVDGIALFFLFQKSSSEWFRQVK